MAKLDDIQLNTKVTEKYEVVDNSLRQEVNDNPKDRITVELGDTKQPDKFYPQVKICRWGTSKETNEVNFSLRAIEDPNATLEVEGEKVKYIADKYEVHIYDKPDASESGGVEFEWVLKEKPSTNVLQATIQTKGLNFFFQPPLTPEEIDEGAERPENVEGSYAVYHATKGGMNRVDGMEYKVGKAFHIYRPKCVDANGNEIWGELNIDADNGLLTVTVDQDFLNSAVYPVVVDPTFGYTAIGASSLGGPAASDIYTYTATASENGTVDSISTYIYRASGTEGVKGVLLTSADQNIVTNGVGDAVTIDTTQQWWPSVYSTSPSIVSGTSYYVGFIHQTSTGQTLRFDSNTGQGDRDTTNNYTTPQNFGTGLTTDNRNYSIYATYTAGDSPAGVTLCTFRPYNNVPTATNFATLDTRNSHPCLDFDATTQETAIFEGIMPRSYSGGDITVYIHFSAESGVTGSGAWGISFERIGDGSQDIDSDGFATEVLTGGFPVSATSGHVKIASTTLTSAEADAVASGEKFRLRIRRSVATDEVAGDLELHGIELRETA